MAEHFAANLRYHSSDIRGGMQKKYAATVACMLLVLATFATIASLYVKTPSSRQSGFLYASGTSLMRDGSAVPMFGVNDDRAFVDTYWGDYGQNYVFPNFNGKIPGVSWAGTFWYEYFRYFLHYQQSGTPTPNLFRVTVGWDFGSEDSYNAWKSSPTTYFADFDSMVTWGKAAGVYIVPMLVQSPGDRTYMWEYFNRSSARYSHLVEFERAMMTKYDNEPQIAMWDIYNEPDVGGYWPTHGGITAYRAWALAFTADVRSASVNHLITMGHAMTSANYNFGGSMPDYGLDWAQLFDLIGIDVMQSHWYSTAEDQHLIDDQVSWAKTIGKPWFVGELGYNAYPSPTGAEYPIGHWPWFTTQWLATGIGPVASMTWLDNGKGAYAEYPYSGPLPDYPGGPPPPPPPPPPPAADTTPPSRVTDLRVTATGRGFVILQWTTPGDDGMLGQAKSYDFRFSTRGPITDANFGFATHVELPFFPHSPGRGEGVAIPGLARGTTYWFALRASDEVPNWNLTSNSPSGKTL